jgi:Aerotolerance regulator N-terminal
MGFTHAYLLAGLVLVGVPVLVHLIMRQKPRQLSFPAFRFLRQTHLINRRKLMLQHWLLMLLRMLLIVFVVLALCMPNVAGEWFPRWFRTLAGAEGGRPVTAVFLFDTGFHMEYQDKSTKRLDQARAQALALYRDMTRNTQGARVAVLDTDEDETEEIWMTAAGQVRGRLAGLRPRPVVAPLPRQLERARRMLQQEASGPDKPLPILYVFSDRTRASWAGEQLKDFLKDDNATNPIRVSYIDLSVDNPEDVAIEGIKVEPPTVGPGKPIKVSVTVRATGRTYTGFVSCQLDTDLDPLPQRVQLDLKPGVAQVVSFDLRAPQRGGTPANAPYQAFGQVTARLVTRDNRRFEDALPFNNSAFATFLIRDDTRREGRKVLTLVDAMAWYKLTDFRLESLELAKVPKEVLVKLKSLKDRHLEREPFLAELNGLLKPNELKTYQDVLLNQAEIIPHRFWEAVFKALRIKKPDKGFECDVLTLARARDLTAKDLEAYRVVCLFQARNPSAVVWDKLRVYVQGGGGLVIVPGGEEMEEPTAPNGKETARDSFNSAALQHGLLPAKFLKLATVGGRGGETWAAKTFEASHPLLQPFREWLAAADPDFGKPANLPFVQRYWQVEPIDKEGVIAFYGNHFPALVEKGEGRGRVVQFTVPLDQRRYDHEREEWHNYARTSFGFVLINELAGYLAGDVNSQQLNFWAGQVVTVPLPPETQARAAFKIDGADPADLSESECVVEAPKDVGENPAVVLPQVVFPGNYRLLDRHPQRVAAFSLNVRPEESQLALMPEKDVEAALGEGAVVKASPDLKLADTLQGNKPAAIELLPLLMILVLAALTFEGSLANRFYRREQPSGAPTPLPGGSPS